MAVKNFKNSLLVATANLGKVREIKGLLLPAGITVESLHDVDLCLQKGLVENGKDFLENALLKARHLHERTGKAVLADDSGLCVLALDGAPGIYSARYSARYANVPSHDEANNLKLLEELEKRHLKNAKAFFHCAMVFIDSYGKEYSTEGRVGGEILEGPRGKNGFGYDPLFWLPGLGKTMAELSEKEKNEVSHRAVALKKLIPIIISSI